MWKSYVTLCLLLSTAFVAFSRLALAGSTYYVERDYTSTSRLVSFGTVDGVGNKSPIGPGFDWNGFDPPRLDVAPNGGLYVFGGGYSGGSAWGSINPSTGVYTQIGDFNTAFLGADQGAQLVIGFNAEGSLTATGISNMSPNQPIFGNYNLTTGAFQQTATKPGITPYIYSSPVGGVPPGPQIATVPNTLIVGGGPAAIGGASATFGNVTSDGTLTSTFIEPTTPDALIQAIGELAARQISFGLSGDTIQLWDLHFSGAFSGLATVTLHFDPALVGNFPLSELFVEHFHNGWVRPDNQVVDTVNDTITFTTDSFSPFILGGQAMAPLDGDYNGDGVVDMADYVVWRENLGTTNSLPNDAIGGVIGEDQYHQWRTNFGAALSSGGSGSSFGARTNVPEPSSTLLAIFLATPALRRGGRLSSNV